MIFSLYPHIRVVNKENKEYIIYDNKKDNKFIINETSYLILKIINESNDNKKNLFDLIRKKTKLSFLEISKFFKLLHDNKIIFFKDNKLKNKNLLNSYNNYIPLHKIAIEVTNKCNLKCLHCYGNFGFNKEIKRELDYEFIESISNNLDILNSYRVALTGGEFFLHSKYNEIFELFDKKGYEITIFTNGLLSEKIIKFLERYNKTKIILKISLDGFEHTHNFIRGNKNSFKNIINLLDYLKYKKNILPIISLTLLKCNIDEIVFLSDFINKEYSLNLNVDIGIPTDFNKDYTYSMNEFEKVFNKYPDVFNLNFEDRVNTRKELRCMGGINMATINSYKKMTICNLANGEDVTFGDLNSSNIKDLWENPPESIKYFRKEKLLSILKCKKCKFKNECIITNCRMLSYFYTANHKNPNPMICFSMEKARKNNQYEIDNNLF